jgi:aromatic ring-opening dioxygenase catalytic subunit (LigB family)
MLYDYSGFPANTYSVQYPAPGSPAVAARASTLLQSAGLDTALNDRRGFDHGVFVPLSLVFPEADVPVVQLSLSRRFDPEMHLAAGRALAPLRDEGVVIMGAGMSFHNMQGFGRMQQEARAFDAWLTATVTAPRAEREARLREWSKAPSARACHPREEHLLPLLIAAGAAGDDAGAKVLDDLAFGTPHSGFRWG